MCDEPHESTGCRGIKLVCYNHTSFSLPLTASPGRKQKQHFNNVAIWWTLLETVYCEGLVGLITRRLISLENIRHVLITHELVASLFLFSSPLSFHFHF